MASASTQKPRQNRISVACIDCHNRRQKCSGEKPICRQCRTSRRNCTWGGQKRRGPVKEEKKMIQRRLEETEDLLWGLLHIVSDELLANAIESRPSTQRLRETASSSKDKDLSTAQLASLGSKKSIWDDVPLNTIAEVRTWQAEYETRGTMLSTRRKIQQDSPVPDEMDLGTPFEQGSWEVGGKHEMLQSIRDTFDYQPQKTDAMPPAHDKTTTTAAGPLNISSEDPVEAISNSVDVLCGKEVFLDLSSRKPSPLNSSVRPSTIDPPSRSELPRQQEEDLFW